MSSRGRNQGMHVLEDFDCEAIKKPAFPIAAPDENGQKLKDQDIHGLPAIRALEQGDHLTRDEFHRRYEAMPHVKKAELIEGVVHMPSPVKFEKHGEQHFDAIGWLSHYRALTRGVRGGDNSTLMLDLNNEPQPDAFLMIEPECGGQVKLENGYILGGPELINEISASSASYDLHSKLEAYRRNNVMEYVVWRVLDNAIDWFVLEGTQYVRLACDAGVYRSRVFPGLWLDVQALLDGNLLKVFETVQQGVATEEHRQFLALLAARKVQ
jgi:Uma2 family endonuclease